MPRIESGPPRQHTDGIACSLQGGHDVSSKKSASTDNSNGFHTQAINVSMSCVTDRRIGPVSGSDDKRIKRVTISRLFCSRIWVFAWPREESLIQKRMMPIWYIHS